MYRFCKCTWANTHIRSVKAGGCASQTGRAAQGISTCTPLIPPSFAPFHPPTLSPSTLDPSFYPPLPPANCQWISPVPSPLRGRLPFRRDVTLRVLEAMERLVEVGLPTRRQGRTKSEIMQGLGEQGRRQARMKAGSSRGQQRDESERVSQTGEGEIYIRIEEDRDPALVSKVGGIEGIL
jgi:hypothetical protein